MCFFIWKYVWKYIWVKKCVKIRIILFKNWKYVFEWVYQTRPKNGEKKASQKVSEKHGLKINCLEGIYMHLKKCVLLFENIRENMCEWKRVWKYIVLKNWKCVFEWVYQTPPKRGEKKDSGIVWCWLISHDKFLCIFGFHLYCNNFLDSLFVEI